VQSHEKGKEKMRIIKVAILCAVALTAAPAFAQEKQVDTNMQILLDKVKADKKLVVAANMDLNETEGQAFWPIYDAYQKDLQVINDRLGKTIVAYADAYNKNSLTDAQAKQLINEALALDQDEITLRKTYATRLERVLPAKKAARYLQIENKIRAAIRYQLAAGIPLVP
jgi:cytochrome c-type biogenesis protein CcmH/NrfG